MSSLSTHVLDSTTGRPAAGMSVVLETSVALAADDGPVWVQAGGGVTDADGRIRDWGPGAEVDAGDDAGAGTRVEIGAGIGPGVHRLTFATGAWSHREGRECFYPEVTIAFTVADDPDGGAHYHVPLLLSPYAYSTYRGS